VHERPTSQGVDYFGDPQLDRHDEIRADEGVGHHPRLTVGSHREPLADEGKRDSGVIAQARKAAAPGRKSQEDAAIVGAPQGADRDGRGPGRVCRRQNADEIVGEYGEDPPSRSVGSRHDGLMTTSRPAWHVASWPALAWLETAVKLVALGVGVDAFVRAGGGSPDFGAGRVAQIAILGVLCLGLLAAIVDRLANREIVAMGFVVLNNLGHLAMLTALVMHAGTDGHLVLFASLMLAGDIIKIVFLKTSNFTVRDTPAAVLFGLTSAYVVGYAALIALAA
jgi:uncharacterized membrane protein YidH (DUF202 family)